MATRYKKTDPADIQDKVKELNDFLFTSKLQYAGQCIALDSKTEWLKDHRQAPDEDRLHQIVKDALMGPKQADPRVKKAWQVWLEMAELNKKQHGWDYPTWWKFVKDRAVELDKKFDRAKAASVAEKALAVRKAGKGKPKDGECWVFNKEGKCARGATCRYLHVGGKVKGVCFVWIRRESVSGLTSAAFSMTLQRKRGPPQERGHA